MRFRRIGDKGFSLTELMFAMTIMAVGLLALAQMQMMAMRGTTSARDFSRATKIGREGMERFKVPGVFQIESQTITINDDRIRDHDDSHNDEASMAPDIKSDTAVDISTIRYDVIEVFKETEGDPLSMVNPICGPDWYPDATCNSVLANDGDWDYARITNVRNWPLGASDHDAVLKEISIVVLWKERGLTRSINLRTLIGRKDNAFF